METVDISTVSLILAFLLFMIPLSLDRVLALGITRELFYSAARMSVQLFLIGIFLKYLFIWNETLINILWLIVMIVAAVISAIQSSSIKHGKVFVPVFLSFSSATVLIVLYLNVFVVRLDNIFDARYLIVLGGMLLGNSLRGNIVGMDSFYKSIRKDRKRFLYVLSLGATLHEALLPYWRESVVLALKPTFAAMATMGIVALPGMMTGVILGGADPSVAIKYQIVIMVAIVVSTVASVVLTILSTLRICFGASGVLRDDVFTA